MDDPSPGPATLRRLSMYARCHGRLHEQEGESGCSRSRQFAALATGAFMALESMRRSGASAEKSTVPPASDGTAFVSELSQQFRRSTTIPDATFLMFHRLSSPLALPGLRSGKI